MDMDPGTKLEIEKTVLSILENADMNDMTEYKVRTLAGEKMGRELSQSVYKKFIRTIIENFLSSRNSPEGKEEEAPEKEGQGEDEEEDKEASKRKQKQKQKHVKPEDDEEEEEEEEGEEEQPAKKKAKPSRSVQEATVDENGDILICKLSSRRSVSIQNFRGQKLISIREYYMKDGKELPSQKGISLTVEQWEAFKKAVPAIEEAIEQQIE